MWHPAPPAFSGGHKGLPYPMCISVPVDLRSWPSRHPQHGVGVRRELEADEPPRLLFRRLDHSHGFRVVEIVDAMHIVAIDFESPDFAGHLPS